MHPFHAQYRDAPYILHPQGLQLHVAPIDADSLGLLYKNPESKIIVPEKQRRIEFFEVLTAGPGFESPYSGKPVANPYKIGDIILADPDDVRIATHGDKKLGLVTADKVFGRVEVKEEAKQKGEV